MKEQSSPVNTGAMDMHEMQSQLALWIHDGADAFQKVPGSAVLIRYIRSSYQNDPIRSAIELVLVIFFIRYLLSPSYSTSKQNFIKLREDVSGYCSLPPSYSLPRDWMVGQSFGKTHAY